MSVTGVEGSEPSRASGTTGATSASPTAGPATAAERVAANADAGSATDGSGRGPGSGRHDLASGLLSDNVRPWQRESLGRLADLLRLSPRDLLGALRGGQGLGHLLAARRYPAAVLVGRFDKGLLVDLDV